MPTTELLLAQLDACPALPAAWHELAYAHARAARAVDLLAALAGRLDLPAPLRAELAAEKSAAVRRAFLARADLTPDEVAGSTGSGAAALASLVAANRSSTAVLAQVGTAFTAKPSRAVALALLAADADAVPVPVAAAVCSFFAGRNRDGHANTNGLTSEQRARLCRWVAALPAEHAAPLLVAARTQPAWRWTWLRPLTAVAGLPHEVRTELADAWLDHYGDAIAAASPTSWSGERRANAIGSCAAALARLVTDLPATDPLRTRVEGLRDDPTRHAEFHLRLGAELSGPTRLSTPLRFAAAPAGPVGGSDPAAVLGRLDPAGRARLAATTTDRQLLAALADSAEVRTAAALLTNAAVTDPGVLLAAVAVVDAGHGDEPVAQLAALARHGAAAEVLAAALAVDAVSVLSELNPAAVGADVLVGVLAALGAAAAADLSDEAWRRPGARSSRPRPTRFGAAALAGWAHTPAAALDELPVPLLRHWARHGLQHSLASDAPPLPADRLWAHVAGVQAAVAACGPTAWATFTGLFEEFAGTLGELAATVGAVLT